MKPHEVQARVASCIGALMVYAEKARIKASSEGLPEGQRMAAAHVARKSRATVRALESFLKTMQAT